ncbi:MAG: C40 family peptidase [Bacteroidales bacterium]|nr:C40 family peptidase [Bacteroidales bacterium]
MYGICNLSMIPMRSEPAETAEMTSQLLFGEAYAVLEEQGKWLKIATTDCQYEGWIDRKLFNPLRNEEAEAYLTGNKYIVKDLIWFIKEVGSDVTFPIFMGSSFPYPHDGIVTLGNSQFVITMSEEKSQTIVDTLLETATAYLHAPYLWGGRTPAGIDCSGFVQIVFKCCGISLPRDASQQALCGETVDFIGEAKAGDVAFFENEEGRIIHTGIIYDANRIIHASGRVRIDPIDQTGIFNQEQGRYTHTLRIIKRILPC